MKESEMADFIESMASLIAETTHCDIATILIHKKGEYDFACSDGFNPAENPEMLEVFMAVMLTAVQAAIKQCGSDTEVFIKRADGITHSVAEMLKKVEKEVKLKLN